MRDLTAPQFCRECNTMKTAGEFYAGRYPHQCRECIGDKVKQQKRDHYARHVAQIAAHHKAYYAANRTEKVAYRANRRAAQPELVKEQKRRSYLTNAETVKQKARDYRNRIGREAQNETHRRYAATPKGRASITSSRRLRKLRIQVASDPSANEKIATIRSGMTECHWCHKPIDGRDTSVCHIDHVIPLSKQGPHTADNIVPACANCNLRKKDKMPEAFMEALAA